jgi:hypothetical protein
MTSEIAHPDSSQVPGSASEITERCPGARPTRLPPAYDTVLGEYAAPLSAETRRTYRSRMRMFLSWLADHAATYSADPLADRQARDWTTSTSAGAWARPTSPAKTCPRARRAPWRSAPASAGCALSRRICRPGAGASR